MTKQLTKREIVRARKFSSRAARSLGFIERMEYYAKCGIGEGNEKLMKKAGRKLVDHFLRRRGYTRAKAVGERCDVTDRIEEATRLKEANDLIVKLVYMDKDYVRAAEVARENNMLDELRWIIERLSILSVMYFEDDLAEVAEIARENNMQEVLFGRIRRRQVETEIENI